MQMKNAKATLARFIVDGHPAHIIGGFREGN
jgi:hypothetical protein